jgi:methionine-S-sulfoxide reductase
MKEINENIESIMLGGGCFWCLDAAYSRVKGVVSVSCGYAGGKSENPTYEQVSTGTTGHAEVVKIEYDKTKISLKDILYIFFTIHDPTTLNRQGNDIGSQYRSIIIFQDQEQLRIIQEVMEEISKEQIYDNKIVTELKKLEKFYLAEDYHQKYYEKNPKQAYCQLVIAPKIKKIKEKYKKFYQD